MTQRPDSPEGILPMHVHFFRWHGYVVQLIYSIDRDVTGPRLVLHDVRARTLNIANAIPDWRIELEASWAAASHDARYL